MFSFFSSLFLSFYLCSLFYFSFVSHPVGYCLLLVFSALSMVFWMYSVSGIAWYLILFCLVYIGGVYVLFVFVSLQDPNPTPYCGGGSWATLVMFITLLVSRVGQDSGKVSVMFSDWSRYLCNYYEGPTYLFFCFVLIFGFVVLSVVGSSKDSFFR